MSSSEYTSDSSTELEVELIPKPVFLKKKTKQSVSLTEPKTNKVLSNLNNVAETEEAPKFDGVSDVDGLDPENEYNEWRVREYNRYIRDRNQMIQIEEEKSDAIRRSNMTEADLKAEFEKRINTKQPEQKPIFQPKLDHSRPTRFKP